MTERCVALLRGINVGKAKRVAMRDLRDLVGQLGFRDVTTLLNSGNVVFTAPRAGQARAAAARIEQAVTQQLGIRSRVTVLSAADIATIVAENTLGHVADNPSRLLVTVLSHPGDRVKLEPLSKRSWAPSVLAVGSRAAYAWCPDGVLASELTEAMGRILGDGATTRNWGTVTKLHALLGAA